MNCDLFEFTYSISFNFLGFSGVFTELKLNIFISSAFVYIDTPVKFDYYAQFGRYSIFGGDGDSGRCRTWWQYHRIVDRDIRSVVYHNVWIEFK